MTWILAWIEHNLAWILWILAWIEHNLAWMLWILAWIDDNSKNRLNMMMSLDCL